MVVRLECISCISEFTSWSPYLTLLQRENPENVHCSIQYFIFNSFFIICCEIRAVIFPPFAIYQNMVRKVSGIQLMKRIAKQTLSKKDLLKLMH